MSAEASPSRSEHASALAPGTRLDEFELQQILGKGGFGIVYLAQDHSLHRRVAIKEYMPASLAGRTETMRVSLRSGSDEESFRLGRESFVKEAKLLARFDHPSLLKVYRYWEANGTAYMAMPILRGRTLKQVRQAQEGPVEEAWLRGILMPLLGAIETLHRENVFHRDIAPDNIMILEDGRPVILDLGAARRVIGDMTQALTVILKTGYAPIEQYGEMPGVRQGPWTDLYALASVVHFALTGRTPPQSVTRMVTDKYQPLAHSAAGQCSAAFLEAIDACLAVLPQHRPQSVAELRALLAATEPRVAARPPPHEPAPRPTPPPVIAVPQPPAAASSPAPPPAPDLAPAPAPAQPRASSGAWVAAGALLLVGAAGLAYTLGRPTPSPQPSPLPAVPAQAPAAPVAAASALESLPASAVPPSPIAVAPPVASGAAPAAATAPEPAIARSTERKPAARASASASTSAAPAPARPPKTDLPADERPPLSPPEVSDRSAWSPDGRPPKVVPVQPPAPDYVTRLKCNDLLQKSALGDPVTDAERSFMQRQCR